MKALRASASPRSPCGSAGVPMRGIFVAIFGMAGGLGGAGVGVGGVGPSGIFGESIHGVFNVTPVGGVTKSHFNSRRKNCSSFGACGTGPPVEGEIAAPLLVS